MERRWDVEDGDRGEGRWIFTREQLERVFAASADREKERRVRGATTEFIRRLGALLELHPSTVTAALLLWQRYFAACTSPSPRCSSPPRSTAASAPSTTSSPSACPCTIAAQKIPLPSKLNNFSHNNSNSSPNKHRSNTLNNKKTREWTSLPRVK